MRVGEANIVVMSGVWKSANVFITEDGEIVEVIPYQYIIDKFRQSLPMACIIQITNRYITDVMPIDEKFEGIECG